MITAKYIPAIPPNPKVQFFIDLFHKIFFFATQTYKTKIIALPKIRIPISIINAVTIKFPENFVKCSIIASSPIFKHAEIKPNTTPVNPSFK